MRTLLVAVVFVLLLSGIDCSIRLMALGRNPQGQLGLGDFKTDRPTPTLVPMNQLDGVVVMAAGGAHSLVATEYGVYVFGNNGYGQLGVGDTIPRCTATLINYPASRVAAGNAHSLLISNGAVFAFGSNYQGMLGIYDLGISIPQMNSPIRVLFTGTPVDISAGAFHSLILDSNGCVYSFGLGVRLGLGDRISRATPSLIKNALSTATVTVISSGNLHSLVLDKKMNVYVFGPAFYGMLGLGSAAVEALTPTLVNTTGFAVQYVHTGGYQSVAIGTSSSSMQALIWGKNYFPTRSAGSLGLGDVADRYTPTLLAINGTPPIFSIRLGYDFGVALDAANNVFAWGNDDNQRLGIPYNTTQILTPTLLSSFPPNVVPKDIATSSIGEHTLILAKFDDPVSGCGKNNCINWFVVVVITLVFWL